MSGQVPHYTKKKYNHATATVFEGKLCNFWNMVSPSVPTNLNVYIGFLYICNPRSGHFRDLPIISQWAKN